MPQAAVNRDFIIYPPHGVGAARGHLEIVQRLLKTNVAQEDVLARLKAARIKGDDQLIKLLESTGDKR